MSRKWSRGIPLADADRRPYLQANPALIEQRLKSRTGHFMPATLARSQFDALEPPDPEERALTIPAGQEIDESVEQVVSEIARRRSG